MSTSMIVGFVVGLVVMGSVWYVKDYCMDSLYLKGYKRGYDKAMCEKTRMAADALHTGLVAGLTEGLRGRDIDEVQAGGHGLYGTGAEQNIKEKEART